MKKSVTIFLFLCYMVPSFGLSVTAHYCGDKIRSIGLPFLKHSNCCGEKKMKAGCCKDKVFSFKITNTQQYASSLIVLPYKVQLVPTFFYSTRPCVLTTQISNKFLQCYLLYPPLGSPPPLYLSHQVFLI